jgi:hypothetical protein
MSIYKCPHGNCELLLRGKDHALRHYHSAHSESEYATPDDYLGTVESKQVDLSLETPDPSGHDPELLVEPDSPDRTDQARLEDLETVDSDSDTETGHD